MATLNTYWPGQFWADMKRSLRWLLNRQGSAEVSNWVGNALTTQGATADVDTPAISPATGGLIECGIESLINFATGITAAGAQASPIPQTNIENIALMLPAGLYADNQQGPDGYPINATPIAMPWGGLLANGYSVTSEMIVAQNGLLFIAGKSSVSPANPQIYGVLRKWAPGTRFTFGDLIIDWNGNVQMALVDGETNFPGSGAPTGNPKNVPTWGVTVGAVTNDFAQRWKCMWAPASLTEVIGPPEGPIFEYNSPPVPGFVATGVCYNLINPMSQYRVDLFVYAGGKFNYQGSSSLYPTGLGAAAIANTGTFSVPQVGITTQGVVMAALYPTSVAQPANGWTGATIPTGWVAHSNTGLGYKLENYKAQLYSVASGVQTLIEDNIPLMVEADEWHCRAGSSVWEVTTGELALHILYDDPVAGWTLVYTSLEDESAFAGLVRGRLYPPSDPGYVPDPTVTNVDALPNRSWTRDNGLALAAFSASGNLSAAQAIMQSLHDILESPDFIAANVLENEQNGVANWSPTTGLSKLAAASATYPLYRPGASVIEFPGNSLIYDFVGAGLPDATNQWLEIEFAGDAGWELQVGVTTAAGKVTKVVIEPTGIFEPALSGTTLTVQLGFYYPAIQIKSWQRVMLDLASIIATYGGDTLDSIASVAIQASGASPLDVFDLTLGAVQPTGSFEDSYDVYWGSVGDFFLSTEAACWVVYGMAVYMMLTQDFTFAADLVSVVNWILTQKSADADLRNGLFYDSVGYYDNNEVYHAGQVTHCSGKTSLAAYFALTLAAQALSAAGTMLQKIGQ